jgi:hypothetical protein
MIPKFNPEPGAPMNIEYRLPTRVENDAQLEEYYQYLKSIAEGEGMGSVTEHDLNIFYHLFEIPQRFSKMKVEKLFGLLEQMSGGERFESREAAQDCLNMIASYRDELSL